MARFARTQGACPVCDRDVARIVHPTHEVFQCPAHGRLEYAQGAVPLAALGHQATTGFEMDFSQPLTGLPLVY